MYKIKNVYRNAALISLVSAWILMISGFVNESGFMFIATALFYISYLTEEPKILLKFGIVKE
jgi:hypothetical protein